MSRARARFQAGVTAYQARRFREAADLFRQADDLQPSARLSYNIAKAYEQMGDDPMALSYYREYLRRLPDADNRLETSRAIARLELALQERGLQQLTVLSTPPGATLLIDGEPRGVTPWTGELAPGVHHVQMQLRGFLDEERDIELPARHALDVRGQLQKPEASAPEPEAAEPPATDPPQRPDLSAGLSPPPAVEVDRARPRWWTWTLAGGTAALAAGAAVAEITRRSAEEAAQSAEGQIEHKDHFDTMESRQTVARVLGGAAAVAGIASGISLYFDLSSAPDSSFHAGLGWGEEGARLMLRSRW